MKAIIDNMTALMPIVVASWALFIFCVIRGRQRIRNSFVLLWTLFISCFALSGLFGDYMREALLAEFALIALLILMVPAFLICNGIIMSQREGRCLSNMLSLMMGLGVAVGEICFIASAFLITKDMNPWYVKLMIVVGWSAFYFCIVFLSFVFYVIAVTVLPHSYKYDYIVIHGCGLIGGYKVSKLLSERLDKAISVYKRCMARCEKTGRPGPMLIPSGGKGDDENLSEAEAMANYLIEHGIPEDRIIKEDQSPSTEANLINSKIIIDGRGGGKTALVTSNYHVYRCLTLAKEIDMKCTGLGARVAAYFWPSAVIREFAAIFSNKKKLFWLMLIWALDIAVIQYCFFVNV